MGIGIKIKSKCREVKTKLIDLNDTAMDMAMGAGADKARRHYAKRWAGITASQGGVGIDYSIPVIALEYKLADPFVIRDLRTKRGAEAFRATLTPEELDIYLHGWSEDGSRSRPYCELEKWTKKDAMKGGRDALRDDN